VFVASKARVISSVGFSNIGQNVSMLGAVVDLEALEYNSI
jgi:hypothetical protein